uniref:K transporter protein n=1 Tax=Fragaria vesca subsp. vesca TaxID=101020 RepID=A0A5J5ZZT5_FRAVE|nr:K transporter protein [Fragaria vesca subsp. vesca]
MARQMDPESASASGGSRMTMSSGICTLGPSVSVNKKFGVKDMYLQNFYAATLCLAYQSLGIVYGDLSISPIYAYKSTFSGGLQLYEEDIEILGVLSMVLWTLTLIPLCKYMIFVLAADDHGEGGSFALYSLLCRHSRMGFLNTINPSQEHISSCRSEMSKDTRTSLLIKQFFEKHKNSRVVLVLVVFLGTGMIIGDGILTPTMSVLSAVYGIKVKVPELHESTEAMFADLGHFSKLSIRVAFTGFIYPCLVLAYMGEAAFLSKHKMDLHRSFYMAIPEVIFWPVFIIATLASVVASQAIISATFSIVSQCRGLRCFPRVKIKHTSNQIFGQIYIPEVNWILMVLCLAVIIGFRDTDMIGNAYGLAAVSVMFITTCLMFLIISTVWKQNILVASLFVIIFGSLELLYISACLSKVHKGGWVPLCSAFIIMSLMSIWNYGTVKKDAFELENKVPLDRLLSSGPSIGIARVPGICLVYSNIPSGLPPMFAHFVTNFPTFHQTLIFVTLQSFMVPKVPVNERFVVSRVGLPEMLIFRCLVRYGYKDARDCYKFEIQLIEEVAEFLKQEAHSKEMAVREPSPNHMFGALGDDEVSIASSEQWRNEIKVGSVECQEVTKLKECREAGVAYMIGNNYIVARPISPFLKKFAISVYNFLRRNCRRPANALGIPHPTLLEVGMLYRV